MSAALSSGGAIKQVNSGDDFFWGKVCVLQPKSQEAQRRLIGTVISCELLYGVEGVSGQRRLAGIASESELRLRSDPFRYTREEETILEVKSLPKLIVAYQTETISRQHLFHLLQKSLLAKTADGTNDDTAALQNCRSTGSWCSNFTRFIVK